MLEKVALSPADYARTAVDVAAENQAADVVMLDIRGVGDFADYFVILTAESSRQMRFLAQDLEDAVERAGANLHHREGTPESGWMLIDFGDIIVHLFGPQERAFYNLEEMWSRAVEVVRIQ